MALPPDAPPVLPTGVVTFLLTDVESSTRLWRESAAAAPVIVRHAELIAAAVAQHGGVQPLEQGEGDSTVSVFVRPSAALAAAADAQRALAAEPWSGGARVLVRMAVHTGEAELRGPGVYGGSAIIRCARLRALAHGGQVLVSSATREVLGDRLPPEVTLAELDSVRLDGFDRSERVLQLCHPDLPASFAPLRGRRSSGLAAWPTALIGRAREREELAGLLARERVLTITGAGGAGKTRLAHAVTEDTAEHYADGVVWVELARLSEDVQVAGTVAAACGVREVPGVPVLELLARALADATILVVLDNCEHLLDGTARVADALARAGAGVRVLATSREPLGAAGEVTWRIPPLGLPPADEINLERLLTFDAVRLFVDRGSASRPGFRLDADAAPEVVRICRRLDGLPLALELAAARVRTLSIQRVADGLDDRFRLLTGGPRTALARQRTLLASVEWSHELLDESERVLFRRLGVFAAPFTVEAAEAVAADDELDRFDVFELLSRLVDKSLVQLAGERYRLLETLRHYALERAGEAGELGELRGRHLAWFQQRAAAWGLDRQVARRAVVNEVGEDAPDLLAALEWSLTLDRAAAVQLLYALAPLWGVRGAYEELRAVASQVLAGLEEGSLVWLEVLAPVATELFFATDTSWMPAARRGLDALGEAVRVPVRASIEHSLALISAFHALPEGLAALERIAETGRSAADPRLETTALLTLVSTIASHGERARLRQLLPWLDRHLPADAWMRFLLDHAHASAEAFDGDFTTARQRLIPYLDGVCQFPITTQAGLVGLWTMDAGLVQRAIAAAERHFSLGAFASSMHWLRALAPLLEGDLDAASRHVDHDPAPWLMTTASSRLRLMSAEIALAHGDAQRAGALVDEVLDRIGSTAMHYFAAAAHLLRAEVLRRSAEIHEAEARAHHALELAAEHQMQIVAVDALETLALLAADTGHAPQAARLLGGADVFRDRTGYRWRHPYRRVPLDALRAGLDAGHLGEGAALSLADAISLARRGRGERRRPEFGWDSLTPTEATVVELVAEDLANRDIAAKLFVSIATVKTHLVHIYTKLDVRSRAALAALATSRQLARHADRNSPRR